MVGLTEFISEHHDRGQEADLHGFCRRVEKRAGVQRLSDEVGGRAMQTAEEPGCYFDSYETDDDE